MLPQYYPELGIFSAIAILDSAVQIMYPNPVDSEYYDVACATKKTLLVPCLCPYYLLLLLFEWEAEILQIK